MTYNIIITYNPIYDSSRTMKHRISLIPGDGIGPEIVRATLDVLKAIDEKFAVEFEIENAPAGDSTLRNGHALPESSLSIIRDSDTCLKGPVGESAKDVIVRLRQLFDLYANLRPSRSLPNVPCLKDDIDLLIVRENTEDLYKGMEFDVGDAAVALRVITRKSSERIVECAFEMASKRKRRVLAVHKSNVMKKTDGLFAGVAREVASKFDEIEFGEMYVDACAMNLIRNPQEFDVIVTTNMFGDILSDEAAQLVGGLGMASSANLGDSFALFEPVHGAAPDITGKGIANPIAMILSMKMMLEWLSVSKSDPICMQAANAVESSVRRTLVSGVRTTEIGGQNTTLEVGQAIASDIRKQN